MVEQAKSPWEGYKLYKVFHKAQGRCYAQLVSPDHRTTTAYARYLVEVDLDRRLGKDETVDHIDDDKTNDVLSNLQLLSRADNIKKSAKGLTLVELECPYCRTSFKRRRGLTHLVKKGYERTFCSRSCARLQQTVEQETK